MDLVLNNLQRLICDKTQTANQQQIVLLTVSHYMIGYFILLSNNKISNGFKKLFLIRIIITTYCN